MNVKITKAEQETSTDIIAEMRRARTEFPFVYRIGESDTPEVTDFSTKEITAPYKINIRYVTVKELADRLEAARKRESGNYAKLRMAVERIRDMIMKGGFIGTSPAYIVNICDAVLAATEGVHNADK